MTEWKECKIADLGTVIGGATPSTKDPANYENGTIAWITPKDLATFTGRYIKRGERNITEIGLKSTLLLLPMRFVQIKGSRVLFQMTIQTLCSYTIS